MSFSDLPATLKRRAKALEQHGFGEDFFRSLLAGADELIIRRKAASGDEDLAAAAIHDNRRLRNLLIAFLNQLAECKTLAPADLERMSALIRRGILSSKELGKGRQILGVEIYPGRSRGDVEAAFRTMLDSIYGADSGKEAEIVDEASELTPEQLEYILSQGQRHELKAGEAVLIGDRGDAVPADGGAASAPGDAPDTAQRDAPGDVERAPGDPV